jgi:hypothetical protein
MRSPIEIHAAENEFSERLWLNRHVELVEGYDDPTTIEKASAVARELLEEYGPDAVVTGEELAFLEGKVSALRWILGWDWDMLDT